MDLASFEECLAGLVLSDENKDQFEANCIALYNSVKLTAADDVYVLKVCECLLDAAQHHSGGGRVAVKCALAILIEYKATHRHWQAYIELMQALDEPQVKYIVKPVVAHIVAPVLPSLTVLSTLLNTSSQSATSNTNSSDQSAISSASANNQSSPSMCFVLHAWHNALHHANGWIRLWSLRAFVQCVNVQSLIFEHKIQFVFDVYLPQFNTEICHRLIETNQLENYIQDLSAFLRSLCSLCLRETDLDFGCLILTFWLANQWSPAAAYFVSKALLGTVTGKYSNPDNYDDVFWWHSLKHLHLMRNVLDQSMCVSTIRLAVQSNLLHLFLLGTNWTEFTDLDVVSAISSLLCFVPEHVSYKVLQSMGTTCIGNIDCALHTVCDKHTALLFCAFNDENRLRALDWENLSINSMQRLWLFRACKLLQFETNKYIDIDEQSICKCINLLLCETKRNWLSQECMELSDCMNDISARLCPTSPTRSNFLLELCSTIIKTELPPLNRLVAVRLFFSAAQFDSDLDCEKLPFETLLHIEVPRADNRSDTACVQLISSQLVCNQWQHRALCSNGQQIPDLCTTFCGDIAKLSEPTHVQTMIALFSDMLRTQLLGLETRELHSVLLTMQQSVRDQRNSNKYMNVMDAYAAVLCSQTLLIQPTNDHLEKHDFLYEGGLLEEKKICWDPNVIYYYKQLVTDSLQEAEGNPSVTLIWAEHLTGSVHKVNQMKHVRDWVLSVIVDLCLFGTPTDKTHRVNERVIGLILTTDDYDNLLPGDPHWNFCAGRRIRALALRSILRLIECEDWNAEYMNSLINLLHHKVQQDQLQTSSEFFMSQHHRVQTRALVVLAVLCNTTLVNDNATHRSCTSLFWHCIALLESKSVQSSIRLLAECCIVLLCLQQDAVLELLWPLHLRLFKARPGAVGSWLNVIMHIATARAQTRSDVLARSINETLVWVSSINFNVRCTAIACLRFLYTTATALYSNEQLFALTRIDLQLIKEQFMQSHDTQGGQFRVIGNLMSDEYLCKFDASHPLKLEYISACLPSLCGMPDDELIDWPLLKYVDFTCDYSVKLFILDENQCSELRPELNSVWRGDCSIQGITEIALPNDQCENGSIRLEHSGKFQKKLVPFVPEEQSLKQKVTDADAPRLIVIASLINKPTNLGGLCRTCEIFGVEQLVLGNLAHVKHQDFKSLSVAAESWLDLKEVLIRSLPDYLHELKAAGYSIIGLEQMTQSIPLPEFQFPRKSAVLLGNEKTGIPPDLIECLDCSVEIPQFGVVRSLNVHVSASLLIYKFAEQTKMGLGQSDCR